MLSLSEMREFKSQLENERKVLVEQLNRKVLSEKDSIGELSSYDNHPADLGTEQFERGKDLALHELIQKNLNAIDNALHAITEGAYGYCSKCHKEIPKERLEVIPYTLYCLEHSPNQQLKTNKPVEESLINVPYSMEVEFDREDAIQAATISGSSDSPSDFLTTENNTYDEMYLHSNESIGSVEEFEDFIGTDINGKNPTGYQGKKYEQAMDEYDEHMIENILYGE